MASLTRLSGDEIFFSRLSKVKKNDVEDVGKENVKYVAAPKAKSKGTRNLKSEPGEDTQNEKKSLKKAEPKKVGRQTRASVREALKPINTYDERSDYLKIPEPKDVGKKSLKPSPSPSKGKRESQIANKIVIYEDARTEIYTMTKLRNGKKLVPRLSKSSEKETTNATDKGRAKSEEKRKTRASTEAAKPRSHSSTNDLPDAASKGEKKKEGKSVSAKPPKRSPLKPRLSKKLPVETVQHPPPPSDTHLKEVTAKLESVFPNVDPEYLRLQCLQLQGSLQDTIDALTVQEKMGELPSKAADHRGLESVNLQNKYATEFSVENFLKIIPDPWEYFLKLERHNCPRYAEHSLHYLKNKFKKHYAQIIQDSLVKHGYSLYLTHKDLNKKNRNLKMRATNRSRSECDANRPTTFDLQFLQEVAFIENEKEIKTYIKKTEANEYKKFKEAQKSEALFECHFCSCSNLLWDEIVNCPAQHVFCKDCVTKKLEMEMKTENFELNCLLECEEKFTMAHLQKALSPEMTATIIRRIQFEEIKPAGIEDLVYCPFCYYVTIMSPELIVLRCLNLSCMKESCRHCKEINHMPLKCKELEEFDMEKTLIEDEKIDPNHPTCLHCKKEFVKEEDTNKMVCPCGATICYICRQPYPDCLHFEGEDHSSGSPNLSTTVHHENLLEFAGNEDSRYDGSNDLSTSSSSETSNTSQDFALTDSHFY